MQGGAQWILQNRCEVLSLLGIELAGYLPAPGFDRRLDYRRRIKFAVQNDGQALMDIIAGNLREALGALAIQCEVDLWFAQIAAHHHRAFDAAPGHFGMLFNQD